jgi:hypothetical protein
MTLFKIHHRPPLHYTKPPFAATKIPDYKFEVLKAGVPVGEIDISKKDRL